ncbi:MAG: hypothetical protein JKX84_02420 [Flavobacteriales bacterium]|nr:hypothetical protein [Flavobacteriales bacterium]
MLKRIGTSLFILLLPLLSFGQLPHPNDTLDGGKKVPFNQFLGRFSVFNELGGAGFFYSFNVAYSLVKTDLVLADLTVGANRIPFGQKEWRVKKLDTYYFPIGLSLYVGRRKSRLNVRAGYTLRLYPSWFTDEDNPYPNCAGICPTPPQHNFFLSLGYTYQHQYGFFWGLNAYGMARLTLPEYRSKYDKAVTFFPSGGLTIGYRLPSRQLHRQWVERRGKGRILRIEDPKTVRARKKRNRTSADTVELVIDSLELEQLRIEMEATQRRTAQLVKRDLRNNGRSHFYAEGFGAANFWSVNYEYSIPLQKDGLWYAFMRIGAGGYQKDYSVRAAVFPYWDWKSGILITTPIGGGIRLMKNYRGGGFGAGILPTYTTENGMQMAGYLSFHLQFHVVYGITGGVAYYAIIDPQRIFQPNDLNQWASFSIGYRLRAKKK